MGDEERICYIVGYKEPPVGGSFFCGVGKCQTRRDWMKIGWIVATTVSVIAAAVMFG